MILLNDILIPVTNNVIDGNKSKAGKTVPMFQSPKIQQKGSSKIETNVKKQTLKNHPQPRDTKLELKLGKLGKGVNLKTSESKASLGPTFSRSEN